MFLAHHDMWQLGCQHGDISVYNLMYRRNTDGDNIVGVLNDWDLSILSNDAEGGVAESMLHFTGTIPFAALDLIEEDEPRRYRHDMESFGWSLAYICLDHPDNRHFLGTWHDPEHSTSVRSRFLRKMKNYTPRDQFGTLYEFAQAFLAWITKEAGIQNPHYQPTENNNRPIPKIALLKRKAPFNPGPAWVEKGENEIWKGFLNICGEWFE